MLCNVIVKTLFLFSCFFTFRRLNKFGSDIENQTEMLEKILKMLQEKEEDDHSRSIRLDVDWPSEGQNMASGVDSE